MMKKLLFILGCLVFCFSVSASEASMPPPPEPIGFNVFADASVADALWSDSLQVQVGVGFDLGSQVSAEIPVSLVFDRGPGNEILLDLALMLQYHPWGDGPFIGVSLASLAVFLGDSVPEERVHCINYVTFGYTWRPIEGLYFKPFLLVRDPSSAFDDSLSYIGSLVPSYGRYKICLQVGWNFLDL